MGQTRTVINATEYQEETMNSIQDELMLQFQKMDHAYGAYARARDMNSLSLMKRTRLSEDLVE